MKKILTLFTALTVAVGAMATDFTDSLEVTVNGVSVRQTATISLVDNTDGTYNFSLKNFMLDAGGGQVMAIGNINLDNVQGTVDNGVLRLAVDRDINIEAGDDPSVSMWMGPVLSQMGKIPVRMIAEQSGSKLYTVINIDFAAMQQVIKVVFGDGGYQIANSGFENYCAYTASGDTIREPLHWHSFASAGGDLAAFVNGTAHTFVSADVRPGSTGKHSVSVKSTSILGIIANGTITTGRMNAGDISATNTKNHAELDLSSTATDANGDPFYTVLNGRPDSIALWVKYGQGKANAQHPYATVSAIITDGTYYQDPEDKAYTNKLAEARNTTIAATGGEWQRLVVPFSYVDKSVEPKAILVTISTNADAGQGSDGDSILVDDLSLIYNAASATAITVKGDNVDGLADGQTVTLAKSYGTVAPEDIAVTTDSDNAKVVKTLEQDGDNATVIVKVASADLESVKTYTIVIPDTKTGVRAVSIDNAAATDAATEVFNLAGQRVNDMLPGQVYVVKKGGKTVKVLR